MKKLVVLTGAGISQESGIPTFRDSHGLWEKYNPEDVATDEAYRTNKGLVIQFFNERRQDVAKVQPNKAHCNLAKLQEKYDVTIFTQNIDDLHERAGSKNVVHLHGHIFQMRSELEPDIVFDVRGDIQLGDLAEDGSQLRPDVVLFGEAPKHFMDAARAIFNADIFVVIGTSLQIHPVAGLVDCVRDNVPIYLIDPNIAPIRKKFIPIPEKATVGTDILIETYL